MHIHIHVIYIYMCIIHPVLLVESIPYRMSHEWFDLHLRRCWPVPLCRAWQLGRFFFRATTTVSQRHSGNSSDGSMFYSMQMISVIEYIYIYIYICMYVCIYWLHKSIYEYINRYKISNQIHYHYFDQWDAGWDPRRSFLRVAPQLACSVFQTFLVRNDLLGSKISNVPGKNACSMCFFFCFWALRICRTSINLSIHLSIIFLFFCQRTPHAWGSYLFMASSANILAWRSKVSCNSEKSVEKKCDPQETGWHRMSFSHWGLEMLMPCDTHFLSGQW